MLSQALAKAKAAHGAFVVLDDEDDEEPEPARPLADDDGAGVRLDIDDPAQKGEEEPAPEAPAALSKQVIEARRDSKGARVVTKPRG